MAAWPETIPVWASLSTGGGSLPPARQLAGLALLKDRGEALLFGGLGAGDVELNDAWLLDTLLGRWTPLAVAGDAPPARHAHSLTWVDNLDPAVPGAGFVVLFGGQSTGADLNDLWMLLPGDM